MENGGKRHTHPKEPRIMLTKTKLTLAAAAAISAATAAIAFDDPESRIGDRYPWLEPGYRSMASPAAVGVAGSRQAMAIDQLAYQDPESKIGDRYPWLEPVSPVTARIAAGRYLVARYAASPQVASVVEDPESRIGDRYPQLELRVIAQRPAIRIARVRGAGTTGSIR
jgi:hypothetical protein